MTKTTNNKTAIFGLKDKKAIAIRKERNSFWAIEFLIIFNNGKTRLRVNEDTCLDFANYHGIKVQTA